MTNDNRLLWLDAVKGAGIILVVLSHSCGVPMIGEYLFACFMPLFFISSGYLIESPGDTRSFIKKKCKRLLVPYVVYGVFLLLLKMRKCGSFSEAAFYWFGFLYSRYCLFADDRSQNIYFLVCGNSAHWFLTAMFIGCILLLPLLNKKYIIAKVILYFIISLLLSNLKILLPWSLDTVFLIAMFIYAGSKLRKIKFSQLPTIIHTSIVIAGTLIYILLVHLNGKVNLSVRKYGNLGGWSVLLFFVIGIQGSLVYMSFCILFEKYKFSVCLAAVGRISITIMCLHKFFFSVFEKTFGRYLAEGYLEGYLKVAFAVLLSFAAAKVWNVLQERYHLRVFAYL